MAVVRDVDVAPVWLMLGALALVVVSYAAWGTYTAHGYFGYTLDDAYIHLALAEGIWQGSWGINPGEAASPSSSFIWPIVLAPFTPFGWQDRMPFVFGLMSLLGAAWVAWRVLREAWPEKKMGDAALAWVVFAVTLGCNGPQLVMSGMEHALVMLVLAVTLWGVVRLGGKGKLPRAVVAGLIALPLVRFELALLALAVGAGTAWRKRWRLLGILGAGWAAGVAVYLLVVVVYGLPWLPSSVLVKSGIDHGGLVAYVVGKVVGFYTGAGRFEEWLLVVGLSMCVLAAGVMAVLRRTPAMWLLAGFVVVVWGTAMNLPLRFIYEGRYHAPLLWVSVVAVLAMAAQVVPAAKGWRHIALVVMTVLVALTALPNHWWRQKYWLPIAVRNIRDEHYQLHKFVTQYYKGAVAAHDIGWVSYRNPYYVLDLAGLANEGVRKSFADGRDAAKLERFAREHKAGLAVVYDSWVPESEIPKTWVRVGALGMLGGAVSAGDAIMVFYATSPEDVAPVMRAMYALFGDGVFVSTRLLLTADLKERVDKAVAAQVSATVPAR